MNNESKFHNVSHKFAQTVIKNQGKPKAINEQLLQMITRIRSLQDSLLEQQYHYELLLQQNNTTKQKLSHLRSKNEKQQIKIKELDEQMELHTIKNKELHLCEESLLILEKQIEDLNNAAQSKEEECEMMTLQTQKIVEENKEIQMRTKDVYQNNVYVNSIVEDFLNIRQGYSKEDHPLDYLRVKLQNLRQSIFEIETKEAEIRKEQIEKVNLQREKTIKLQFEEQLLRQRENDDQKIKAINSICQNQQNLEKVVEEMLVKEDQLINELNNSKSNHENLERSISEELRKLEEDWDEQRQMLYRQIRELKKLKEKLVYQAQDWQNQTIQRKQKLAHMSQQQQMLMRMNEELYLMRRLRQAEQRNNYLKLKTNEATQIKHLLMKEKEIISSNYHRKYY